jgi:hypothetical protein
MAFLTTIESKVRSGHRIIAGVLITNSHSKNVTRIAFATVED